MEKPSILLNKWLRKLVEKHSIIVSFYDLTVLLVSVVSLLMHMLFCFKSIYKPIYRPVVKLYASPVIHLL